MTACKTALDIFEHTDDKNKMLIEEVAGLYNSYNLFYTPHTIIILINNNLNIEKQFVYKKTLVNFS